ncbi:MAG TPA: hypothetical protein VLB82_06605 [Thermodesulfobacteriota bacterium]|nr:hypothetical protein [Thermodesulfobacteriota bacterium]
MKNIIEKLLNWLCKTHKPLCDVKPQRKYVSVYLNNYNKDGVK